MKNRLVFSGANLWLSIKNPYIFHKRSLWTSHPYVFRLGILIALLLFGISPFYLGILESLDFQSDFVLESLISIVWESWESLRFPIACSWESLLYLSESIPIYIYFSQVIVDVWNPFFLSLRNPCLNRWQFWIRN